MTTERRTRERPDAKLVSFPGSPPPERRGRDPRIDAFRGIALAMILIDHMPGNPFEEATIRNFGFSDAAEAFFVMSGIAAGIAYSGAVERWMNGQGRLWPAIVPMWNRAWTLYLVQIMLSVLALGLFAWAADTFTRGEFRTFHNIGLVYSDTGGALVGLATLGYQIGYVNILPAYMVLLLAAPVVVMAGLRAPRATLAASLALWFFGGLWEWNLPNHPGGGGWFFSPVSWQVVFVLGLLIGIRHRKGERLVPVSRPLFALSASFLVLVLVWKFVPPFGAYMNNKMAELAQLGAPYHIVSHTKTYLGLPRLLHILALTYVISCLPFVGRATARGWAAPLRLLGRQGLLVFGWGTILALAGQILMDAEPDSMMLGWVLPPVALAISYMAAWVKDRSRRPPAPPTPRTSIGIVEEPPLALVARR